MPVVLGDTNQGSDGHDEGGSFATDTEVNQYQGTENEEQNAHGQTSIS